MKERKNMEHTLRRLRSAEPFFWPNPDREPFAETARRIPFCRADIENTADRFRRFAPVIAALFPQTQASSGIIESELIDIPAMAQALKPNTGEHIPGRLLLKLDSHLPIAGSVKSRGGVYEVLKHAEELALREGLLNNAEDDHEKLLSPAARGLFSRHILQVGSTGNLGMSIGIMGAALGFRAIVHMSADARQWKKDLLRGRGVEVIEYSTDYSEAVGAGRQASESDPTSYFVDDEHSSNLFLGYSAAAIHLKRQLEMLNVAVDENHPLFVYLPCGIGGAPGGITFGLKHFFGDAVHCVFAEPVQAPCMLLGLLTGKHDGISVRQIGLTGMTQADGLAVSRPSGLVGKMMGRAIGGVFTVKDETLLMDMRMCYDSEGIFLEPSACAGFRGWSLWSTEEGQGYLAREGLAYHMDQSTHIVWATGGAMVPELIQEHYLKGRISNFG